jgi:uncharacterized protein YegP (UPF0339 family)
MKWWKRFKTPDKVEVYQDAEGRWRWKAIAGNGKIIDASEQSYASKYYATGKAERYAEAFGAAVITP